MKTRIGLGLVLIGLLLSTLHPPDPVQAQSNWFDSNWQYRRSVHVSNSGAATLTQIQVLVTLDASFDFSRADADGADVRFAAGDGVTPLPFWIEAWDPVGAEARLWVRMPSLAPGTTEFYLYYGNLAAASGGDGNATFEFFDDFESFTTASGYYPLSAGTMVLEQDQAWEEAAPHTLSVVEVNQDGYRYWGYYGLQTGNGGVGLARSNDLLNWEKYDQNPLFYNGRFPSIVKVDGIYYMAVTKDYAGDSHIVLRTSTNGLNFTEVATLVQPTSGRRNQTPNLFLNPNDGLYYLYWYSNNSGQRDIKAKSAADPMDLDDATEVIILSSPVTLAAPNMMYYDGSYSLSTEIYEGEWKVRIYESTTSPISGFSPLPDNPILGDGSACFFQHVFDDTLHAYYCKLTGSVWTVDHRAADLTAGKNEVPEGPDPAKWSASGGAWALSAATQHDGSSGWVAQGSTSAHQILQSSFTGDDYILEAYGQQLAGGAWGLGSRVTNDGTLYSSTIYEDLDGTQNLHLYRWIGGSPTTVASTSLGPIGANRWYKMTVKAHDTDLEVLIDDTPQIATSDSQIAAGSVALNGEAGTLAQFDQVLVRKYASPEPAASVGTEEELRRWYDPDWYYRAPITIHDAGDALTDYQVLIVLDSSNFAFSRALPDGADVRFTAGDKTSLLPFWIESWDAAGEQARIWVRVPALPAGDTVIYLYYGNPSAATASDGGGTFVSFDSEWSFEGNPIHTVAGEGPWVTSYVSYPNVFEDEGTYHMLYDGHAPYQKGLATSADLFHWISLQEPVVAPSGVAGAWDEAGLACGDTVKIGRTYYMLVAGLGGDDRWRIGVETSSDLADWALAPAGAANPVLTASETWEGGTDGSLSGPSILKSLDGITPVLHSDGHYWMAYHSSSCPQIGLAHSDHPLGPWTKYAGNPILSPTEPWESAGLRVASLVEESGVYYLFYYGGVPGGYSHIGYAWSDAVTEFPGIWHKSADHLLEYGAAGSWDDRDHQDPIIRKFGDTYYLFYTGLGSVYANGVATSAAITGPYTKYESNWQVVGTPEVSAGVMTLGSGDAVQSLASSAPNHALGFRASFGGNANLTKWGGFLAGQAPPLTYIGQATGSGSGNLILTNYVTSRGVYDLGPADPAFHTYELAWLPERTDARVDYALAGKLSDEVPQSPLPFQFQNQNDAEYPLQVDWMYLRSCHDPEPASTVGDEETHAAIDVTRFEATPGVGYIVVTWETAIEIDNLGFNLYRSEHASSPYTQLNDTLIPSQAGELPGGATYEWTDAAVAAGVTYNYQLEAVDTRGGLVRFGPVSATPDPARRHFIYLPVVCR